MNYEKWDKLNLKIKDVDTVKMLLASGMKEQVLYNLLVSVHNIGFVKGKTVVLNELNEIY